MERLRSRLAVLALVFVVFVVVVLLVTLPFRSITRRLGLGLFSLLLHSARRPGDVQAHLADLVRHGAEALLARDGVLVAVGGRRGQGRGKLERDFGLVDRGVLDEVERHGEGGFSRDEEREVVGLDFGDAPVPAADADVLGLERDVVVLLAEVAEPLKVVLEESVKGLALLVGADAHLVVPRDAVPLDPLDVAAGHGHDCLVLVGRLPSESRRRDSQLCVRS